MKERIIIVDDEDYVRDAITLTLEQQGYAVIPAHDGEEALKTMEKEPVVDLVITDIAMPAMDGYELLKRIRQDPQTKLLPVVLLTQKDSTKDVLTGWNSGAESYLTKPFTSKDLVMTVKHVLAENAKGMLKP